jgi:NTP pyrophosphatase (non-canonical NTP hydrolase)
MKPLSDPSLRILQEIESKFDRAQGWEFSPSQIFIHLIEELGEIGSHLLWQTGYKTEQAGHQAQESKDSLESEFGQCLSLFLHLANSLGIDLQAAYLKELEKMKQRFEK